MAPFTIYYHIKAYSVRDWLWPWEVLRFEKVIEITSQVRFPVHIVLYDVNRKARIIYDSYIIRAVFPEVREIERFQTAKVTFKVIKGQVIKGHRKWCQLIGHVRFHNTYDLILASHCNHVYLAPFPIYYFICLASRIPKIWSGPKLK